MNVQQIFDLGVKLAIEADPRGEKGVKKYLTQLKKEYEDLKEKDKKYFNTDKLTNPYPDSCIHTNDQKTTVQRVLSGIDIGAGEILLASQLSERNQKIDLVISHHPTGNALSNLHEVMEMSIGIYESFGLPVHIAEKFMEERIKEIGRSVHPINHHQTVDVAALLGINFMSTHTITDNLVDAFLSDYLKTQGPETLRDILDCLLELPEYQEAKRRGAGPKIFAGNPKHHVGKILVEMTGGTNPSSKIYKEFSKIGYSTIVSMHMKDDAMNKASEEYMNVVIAGHMSSDSLGMNLYLDELEKQGIEIIPCGGLIRVSRNK